MFVKRPDSVTIITIITIIIISILIIIVIITAGCVSSSSSSLSFPVSPRIASRRCNTAMPLYGFKTAGWLDAVQR